MKLTPGDLKPLKYNFKTITFQSSNLLVYDIGKYLLIQHASSWTSSLILYCHRWLIEAGMGGGQNLTIFCHCQWYTVLVCMKMTIGKVSYRCKKWYIIVDTTKLKFKFLTISNKWHRKFFNFLKMFVLFRIFIKEAKGLIHFWASNFFSKFWKFVFFFGLYYFFATKI